MAKFRSGRRGRWVYTRWITCPRTGRRIYPKRARVFRFWVED